MAARLAHLAGWWLVQVLWPAARHQGDCPLEGVGLEQQVKADSLCREEQHPGARQQEGGATLQYGCQPIAHLLRGVRLLINASAQNTSSRVQLNETYMKGTLQS